MSDYKFEILSELVKHDDFANDSELFWKKVDAYEETLQELFDNELIEREFVANKNSYGKWYNTGIKQTKITLKGRNYYYESLLPTRNPETYPIKKVRPSIIIRVYIFITKHILASIVVLASFIAAVIKIWQFLVENNWWGLGKG